MSHNVRVISLPDHSVASPSSQALEVTISGNVFLLLNIYHHVVNHCPTLGHITRSLSRAKLAPTRNALPNNSRTHPTITSHFITAPNPSSNQVISRTRDRGNLSHDPSRDLPVPNVSRDLTARDPGTIAHDPPRNWSSSTSQDHTRFGHATRPLIKHLEDRGKNTQTRNC